jgi:hypothetical protein
MNSTWVIDEYSDVSEGREVRNQKNIVMDALRNPHKPRPEGEWICGEIIRQWVLYYLIIKHRTHPTGRFWAGTIKSASVQTQKRFIAIFDKFLESIVQQAIDRDGRQIRNVQSYIDMRRDTGGVRPALVLIELGLDIPDDVFLHPAIEVMMTATNDMICLDNVSDFFQWMPTNDIHKNAWQDMLSYNVEQTRGDYHNIVAIAMHEFDTDVNGAMLWVADHYKEVEKKFFEAKAALPKWGEPIDSQVRQYCDGLGSWVRGNDEWSFETERYFGSKGPEIKRKRWNMLIPKDRLQKLGPRETGPVLVDSLL